MIHSSALSKLSFCRILPTLAHVTLWNVICHELFWRQEPFRLQVEYIRRRSTVFNYCHLLVLQIGVVLFWLHLLISLVRLYQRVILVNLTPWVYMIGQYQWNYGEISSQCIGTYQIRMSSQLHWRSLNCRYCNWQFWPVCTEHYVAQPYQWDVIMWYSVLVWYLCFFRQGDCLKRNSEGMMVLALKHISDLSPNPGIHRDKLNILLQSLWWWRL